MAQKNYRAARAARRASVTRLQRATAQPVEQLEERVLFSTYIVTTAGDGAAAAPTLVAKGIYAAPTLRAAIAAANARPGADLILLNPFFKGTITLDPAAGELPITDDVAIQGFGADRQAINGNGASRVFSVAAGVTASISDLTVSNGVAAESAGGGGGIRNLGSLTLRDCTIRDCHVITNDGGGLFNAATGVLTIVDCTLSNNVADGSGGGLFNRGVATLINSTVAGNTATFGGGISSADGATLTVTGCTVSANHATVSGGGIAATKDLDPTFPGGVPSTTLLNNTIVSGNTFNSAGDPTALGPNLYGFFNPASSNNLIGNLGFAKGMDATKNILGSISDATPAIDAMLLPLGNYGGTTQTMPPKKGSLAIDRGNNALIPSGIKADQRGQARIANSKVDIGAVETPKVWNSGATIGSPSGNFLTSPTVLSLLLNLSRSWLASR